jgi:hypothetical protein
MTAKPTASVNDLHDLDETKAGLHPDHVEDQVQDGVSDPHAAPHFEKRVQTSAMRKVSVGYPLWLTSMPDYCVH